MYENIRDGRITADEFFDYSKTHQLDVDDSKVAFGTFDKNGKGLLFSLLTGKLKHQLWLSISIWEIVPYLNRYNPLMMCSCAW